MTLFATTVARGATWPRVAGLRPKGESKVARMVEKGIIVEVITMESQAEIISGNQMNKVSSAGKDTPEADQKEDAGCAEGLW